MYVRGDLPEGAPPSGVTAVGDPDAADFVVAIGESALLAAAREGRGTPILPVDTGSGVRSVPASALEAALASVRQGDASTFEVPVLGVDVGDERRARALLDVMLVTEEAAHISEFELATESDEIARFRADGVLVATAAGTSGYASRLGAPAFAPEVAAAAAVPVASFSTAREQWVVPVPDAGPVLETRVTRDDAAISLLVDDRDEGYVPANVPVTISVVDSLSIYRVPESQSCFATPSGSPQAPE